MKIGINAYFLDAPFNGIGQVTNNFLHALAQSSTAVPAAPSIWSKAEFFIYTKTPAPRSWPANFHLRVLPLPWREWMPIRFWWEIIQLPTALRRDGCDLLISLYQAATVLPQKTPHVMLVHDVIYAIFPEFRQGIANRIALQLTIRGIRGATGQATVSHHTKADMVRVLGLDANRITVAHNAAGSSFRTLAPQTQIEESLKKHNLTSGYIYHGGGLHHRKNAHGVLTAYRILLDRAQRGNLPFSLPPLVISGGRKYPDYEGVIERTIREQGLNGHVHYIGRVAPEDLPAIYRAASVFIFPSFYEGFGLPLLEAMHQGIPIVAADTSSLPEIAGEAALYCAPDQAGDIANAIQRVLSEPNLAATLSRHGRERAARFTWESFLQNMGHAATQASEAVRRGRNSQQPKGA